VRKLKDSYKYRGVLIRRRIVPGWIMPLKARLPGGEQVVSYTLKGIKTMIRDGLKARSASRSRK
jgi:hypothetical protein